MSRDHDDERDEIIGNFIKQALTERDRKRGTLGDLKAIAAEVGLDERDLAKVDKAAQAHFDRGSGYGRHGRFDEAIAELSVSAALRPTDPKVTLRLAEAYAGRWRAKRDRDDRTEAERLAKRCVELQPGFEPAFALLESLDQDEDVPVADGPPRARSSKGLVATIVVGGLLGVVLLSSRGHKDRPRATEPTATGRPVELSLVAGAAYAGMTVQLERSREMTKEHVYCAEGDVTPPPGAPPPSSVPLKLEMHDGAGAVLASDLFTAWPCPKHPGAFHFHRDNPMDARLARAVLSVQPIGGR
jgi:tetratricopeptide (TPR) repeat protein